MGTFLSFLFVSNLHSSCHFPEEIIEEDERNKNKSINQIETSQCSLKSTRSDVFHPTTSSGVDAKF